MKKVKQLYLVFFVLAVLTGLFLIYLFFPSQWYLPAAMVLILPLVIMGLSYQFITRTRLRRIREQIYQITNTLEDFDVDEPTRVQFEASPFPLFNELNEYLLELINRVRSNYRANKQFTQNASHELQTPLAIIKGNAELLLQSPNIKEKEMKALGTILQNVNRLSKLNSALILLSKIEHSRFADHSEVNFSEVVDEVLKNFKDIIRLQDIKIEKDIKSSFVHEMSGTLAETLINNLIQNAIRYNLPEDGKIYISMDADYCRISNPGNTPAELPSKMFKRFRRVSEIEESLGLGLSIVQSICEQSNLEVSYTYEEDLHQLSLRRS